MITTPDRVMDPLYLAGKYWPDLVFSREQKQIISSVRDNVETYVAAGNDLGKDFVAAFIALWFFLSRRPCRVVATSVSFKQLHKVFWGEFQGFIARSRYKLPLRVLEDRAYLLLNDGTRYQEYASEILIQCVQQNEAIIGGHTPRFGGIPRTLVIFDEASGISSEIYDSTTTWAHRRLAIGNCWPCENFFKEGVEAGDEELPDEVR
jgi:hypothetical protein